MDNFRSVWGTGVADVWAVGSTMVHEAGTVREEAAAVHWDGVSWSPVVPGVDVPLVGVWASSDRRQSSAPSVGAH